MYASKAVLLAGGGAHPQSCLRFSKERLSAPHDTKNAQCRNFNPGTYGITNNISLKAMPPVEVSRHECSKDAHRRVVFPCNFASNITRTRPKWPRFLRQSGCFNRAIWTETHYSKNVVEIWYQRNLHGVVRNSAYKITVHVEASTTKTESNGILSYKHILLLVVVSATSARHAFITRRRNDAWICLCLVGTSTARNLFHEHGYFVLPTKPWWPQEQTKPSTITIAIKPSH